LKIRAAKQVPLDPVDPILERIDWKQIQRVDDPHSFFQIVREWIQIKIIQNPPEKLWIFQLK